MCHLPGWYAYNRCIKVDILTSRPINLPVILVSDTPQINNIPVMPLFARLFDLLVMKTAGGTTLFRRTKTSARR